MLGKLLRAEESLRLVFFAASNYQYRADKNPLANATQGVIQTGLPVAIATPLAKLASVNDYLADCAADKPLTTRQVKKIKRMFEGEGTFIYFPPKVRFHSDDIFGAFDCIIYYKSEIHLIQITTLSNISHRRKKIEKIFNHDFPKNSFIYAYNEKHDTWKIHCF